MMAHLLPRPSLRFLASVFPAFLLVAVACRGGDGRGSEPAVRSRTLVARSPGAMVVSGSRAATLVGTEMLTEGGNAVDAAVAGAFALAVAEPSQSGLGGRTQGLVLTGEGEVYGIDATTEVPGGYDFDAAPEVDHGYATVAVPGTVAGLLHLHERFGALPRGRVMAPAIRLAREGVILSEGETRRLATLAREPDTGNDAARRYFAREDGSAYAAGDRLVQRDLARTLETVARHGARAFYRGAIADRIAADVQRSGGWVDREDLAAYRPRDARVVRGGYGGLEVVGTYLPASGFVVIEALQILERFELGAADLPTWTAAVGQALLLAYDDRDVAEGEPRPGEPVRTADEWADLLTSEAWADARAGEIRLPGADPDRPAAGRGTAAVRRAPEPAHTTHLSVLDGEGTAVALTQSLGPTMGSRVATPGLGFLYAATLGGYLGEVEPGERAWSSQAPLLLLRGGRPAYVMGGAGARRILSALVQTISRMEDQGLSVVDAVAAPRFHPTDGTFILEEEREPGWPVGVDEALTGLGFTVERRASSTYFARLNVIRLGRAEEEVVGVADPRWPWGAASGTP